MREIKFISRHPENSTRLHGEIANRWGFNEYGYFHENGLPDAKYIQCQFTGLKDSKGVEIYEGDIVQYKVSEQGKQDVFYPRREVVRFDAGSFKAGFHLSDWHTNQYPTLRDHLYVDRGGIMSRDRYFIEFDIEVIGNRFEHPYLLNPEHNG